MSRKRRKGERRTTDEQALTSTPVPASAPAPVGAETAAPAAQDADPPAPEAQAAQPVAAAPDVLVPPDGRLARLIRKTAWVALIVAMAAYVAGMGAYTVLDHMNFRTQVFDLGIFDQALWLVSHGHTPFITVRGLHRFGDHIEFILYVVSPLYWIFDDVRAAILFQTVVLALGAVPLFLMARERLGYAAAGCFGVAYTLNAAVQNMNMDHVHAEAIASAALIYAFYFAMRRRTWLLFLCAALAMLCKEDVAIATGMLGAYVAWRWDRKAGIALAVASAVWFALCMKVFLPHFNQVGFFRMGQNAGWFSEWAAHRQEVDWYVRTIFKPAVGMYIFQLFALMAFLPILSPATVLLAAPAVAINILSNVQYLRSIEYHYTAMITPFMFAAAVEGMTNLVRPPVFIRRLFGVRLREEAVPLEDWRRVHALLWPGRTLLGIACAGLLVATCWTNALWSHLPALKLPRRIGEMARSCESDERVRAIRAAIQMIPPDAVVSADYLIAAHLTHRKWVYMFMNPFIGESWGIHDENPHNPAMVEYVLILNSNLNEPRKTKLADWLATTNQFTILYASGDVRLFKRIASPPPAPPRK